MALMLLIRTARTEALKIVYRSPIDIMINGLFQQSNYESSDELKHLNRYDTSLIVVFGDHGLAE